MIGSGVADGAVGEIMLQPSIAGWCLAISIALAATACGTTDERVVPPPAATTAAPAEADDTVRGDAAAAAAAFYRAHLHRYGDEDAPTTYGFASGLPRGARLAAYRPLLTRALWQRLERAQRAQRAQTAFIAKYQGDMKPPLIEGDVFSSAAQDEMILSFALGRRSAMGADAERVQVVLTGSDLPEGQGPGRQWRDEALMRREDGMWKLDDIEFDNDGGSTPRERLSHLLEKALE
ncbi:hypothetical protein [Lysobacter sp. CA196]|uniref:hypothetical protein n=1 Tax=Lysobacter sp. CA196 TaxID=3455606 RepID=UPI003F8D0D82